MACWNNSGVDSRGMTAAGNRRRLCESVECAVALRGSLLVVIVMSVELIVAAVVV